MGAWIETAVSRSAQRSIPGRPLTWGRGLKQIRLWSLLFSLRLSPPHMGAWIETHTHKTSRLLAYCRPLTWGRGLKLLPAMMPKWISCRPLTRGRGLKLSAFAYAEETAGRPPHTGAWIETYCKAICDSMCVVAPSHGGVD